MDVDVPKLDLLNVLFNKAFKIKKPDIILGLVIEEVIHLNKAFCVLLVPYSQPLVTILDLLYERNTHVLERINSDQRNDAYKKEVDIIYIAVISDKNGYNSKCDKFRLTEGI